MGVYFPFSISLFTARMASDESMMKHEDDDDDEYEYGYDDTYGVYNNPDCGMEMYVSGLSIESCDTEAEQELSETRKLTVLSSDSDREQGCYSLPATPLQLGRQQLMTAPKECASENNAPTGKNLRRRRRKSRSRRIRWPDAFRPWKDNIDSNENKTEEKEEDDEIMEMGGRSGESEGAGGGGLMVITRPIGGRRSLCMGLEEVKACKDLGFELEPMDVCISISGSNSSGGNSPIANWRISNPGDNPRDVKARLKIWAQAVALGSTSRRLA